MSQFYKKCFVALLFCKLTQNRMCFLRLFNMSPNVKLLNRGFIEVDVVAL